jgi:tetraacyldisaccharide 4'-kinase
MILQQPLTFLFGAGVNLRNGLYDTGRLKTRELAGPVVSIGNISVGGAGKTPFTILLGELLKARGIAFDILSRGYGRSTTGSRVVDPNGTSREFGDEPILMARKLGVPVLVGEDRYDAGMLAERTHGARLHLLDDGFQHRRLQRQFDIVLVTPEDLDDCLLPAGRLREPRAALARADAVVMVGEDREPPLAELKKWWRVRRGIAWTGGTTSLQPEEGLQGAPVGRPIVFCGIARPQRFLAQLREKSIKPVAVQLYRDHHSYSQANVRHLLRLRDRHQARAFVTTEKDVVNLGSLAEQLQPLFVASVHMTLEQADHCLDSMLATLKARGKLVA